MHNFINVYFTCQVIESIGQRSALFNQGADSEEERGGWKQRMQEGMNIEGQIKESRGNRREGEELSTLTIYSKLALLRLYMTD